MPIDSAEKRPYYGLIETNNALEGKTMRLYNVIWKRDDTGACGQHNATPLTHGQACALLSKLTTYPWRRDLLEGVLPDSAPNCASETARYAAHQMADYAAKTTGQRIDVAQRGVSGRLHYSLADGNLLACSSTTLDQLTTAAKRAAQ